jgi:CheY-like chemotaxis protein
LGIKRALLVILSDIKMPGMDGLQLLTEIKRRFPDLPVMMVTAHSDDHHRRSAPRSWRVRVPHQTGRFRPAKAWLRRVAGAAG